MNMIARINALWTAVWHARFYLTPEAYFEYRRMIVKLARINRCEIKDRELAEVAQHVRY